MQHKTAEKMFSAANIRDLFGISDMTVWRWVHDSEMGFPAPVYIGRRRYWRESEIAEFQETRPTICPVADPSEAA